MAKAAPSASKGRNRNPRAAIDCDRAQAETSRHTHMKTCPDCNGDGVVDKDTDDERQCPTCGGLGFVPDDDDDHEEVIKTVSVSSALSIERRIR